MFGKMCGEGVAVSHKIERKGFPASNVAYLLYWIIIIIIIFVVVVGYALSEHSAAF
jgi:hypothetical protein